MTAGGRLPLRANGPFRLRSGGFELADVLCPAILRFRQSAGNSDCEIQTAYKDTRGRTLVGAALAHADPKQMEKMAAAVGRNAPPERGLAPDGDLPPEYWQALLADARADGAGRARRVRTRAAADQIPQHLLRVDCRRCGRTVEIQKVDAVRLYGPDAIWKDVGQRLLDNTCTQRTGRHEEDGCWPSFE